MKQRWRGRRSDRSLSAGRLARQCLWFCCLMGRYDAPSTTLDHIKHWSHLASSTCWQKNHRRTPVNQSGAPGQSQPRPGQSQPRLRVVSEVKTTERKVTEPVLPKMLECQVSNIAIISFYLGMPAKPRLHRMSTQRNPRGRIESIMSRSTCAMPPLIADSLIH